MDHTVVYDTHFKEPLKNLKKRRITDNYILNVLYYIFIQYSHNRPI